MELLEGTASRTALTADTGAERPHLPAADGLGDALLLADRGYFDVHYLAEVDRAGGHFAVRAGVSINPTVLRATANDRELADLRDRPLKQCDLPKTGAVDLDVSWRRGATTLRARLVARWNPKREAYVFLVTNLPRERVSAEQVGQVYRCAGKWNCCSRSGSRTPTCAPSTPPTRTSPRGWSGPRSPPPRSSATSPTPRRRCAALKSPPARSPCAPGTDSMPRCRPSPPGKTDPCRQPSATSSTTSPATPCGPTLNATV